MKAYFAVGDAGTALRMLRGHRMLISFAYVGTWVPTKHLGEISSASSGLMIDSGAFTAWRKGTPIGLEAYANWLADEAPVHEWAIGLDVIGDADASMANWQELRARFPKLIPVWHEGDPTEHLAEYVAHADLIGLGRTDGRRSETKTFEFYDDALNRYPDAAFHALGNSSPVQLEGYPFTSFDSTGWQRDAAYTNAARWPYNRCEKDTRLRAYIEATETIEYRQPAQGRLFGQRRSA